jgi:hypothetical protein
MRRTERVCDYWLFPWENQPLAAEDVIHVVSTVAWAIFCQRADQRWLWFPVMHISIEKWFDGALLLFRCCSRLEHGCLDHPSFQLEYLVWRWAGLERIICDQCSYPCLQANRSVRWEKITKYSLQHMHADLHTCNLCWHARAQVYQCHM